MEEVSIQEIIFACEESLKNLNLEMFLSLLPYLELSEMKTSDQTSLFYFFVSVCEKESLSYFVAEIRKAFEDLGSFDTYTNISIFLHLPPNIEVFEFFYKNNLVAAEEYVRSLFQVRQENVILTVFEVLRNIPSFQNDLTEESSRSLLRDLYCLSEEEAPLGDIVEEQLKMLISMRASLSQKPSYIILKDGSTSSDLPTEEELFQLSPKRPETFPRGLNLAQEAKEIAHEIIEEKIASSEISIDRAASMELEILDKILSDYDPFENRDNSLSVMYRAKKWEKGLQKDSELFRIFGPCHPKTGHYELNSNSSSPCLRNGGCRMFTCVEFEDEDDEEDSRFNYPESVTWFHGHCDRCSNKIPEKHWAFRIALLNGGFVGCYCSSEHALQDCVDRGLNGAAKLTKKIALQIQEIGIYDRIANPKETRKNRLEKIRQTKIFLDFLLTNREEESLRENNEPEDFSFVISEI